MQAEDGRRGHEAIDAEEIPAATLQPTGEPPKRQQAREKSEDHAQEAGSEIAPGHGGAAGFVPGLD
jgi:hypothetical protein